MLKYASDRLAPDRDVTRIHSRVKAKVDPRQMSVLDATPLSFWMFIQGSKVNYIWIYKKVFETHSGNLLRSDETLKWPGIQVETIPPSRFLEMHVDMVFSKMKMMMAAKLRDLFHVSKENTPNSSKFFLYLCTLLLNLNIAILDHESWLGIFRYFP